MYYGANLQGFSGYGFGLDVPTPKGPATVGPTGYNYCGSVAGTQQMLQTLGFYSGTVDGAAGNKTSTAIKDFGLSIGMSPKDFASGIPNSVCQALMDAWVAKQQTVGGGTPGGGTAGGGAAGANKLKFVGMRSKQLPAKKTGGGGGGGKEDSGGGGAAGWWNARSTPEKVAVVGGGLAVVGALAWLLWPKGEEAAAYAPNRKRSKRAMHRQYHTPRRSR